MKTNKRIDAYIARSPDFAPPILEHLRELIHAAVPGVQEDIKWGVPAFMHHGLLAGMAAFKGGYCYLNIWPLRLESDLGRISSLKDLPKDRELTALIRRAAAMNEGGEKPKMQKKKRAPLPMPAALKTALGKNAKVKAAFADLPPSHQREYIEWITEAKTDPTRDKRIATTIEWVHQGKSRNWKYK